jgi:hypothetical protein
MKYYSLFSIQLKTAPPYSLLFYFPAASGKIRYTQTRGRLKLPCFCYLCSTSQSLPGSSVSRRKRSFNSDGWACSLQGRLPLSLSRTPWAPRGGDVDFGTDCFLCLFGFYIISYTVLFFKQSVIRSIF